MHHADLSGLSIHEQIRNNRFKTAYLFIIFPVIIIGLTYIGILISLVKTRNPIAIANSMMETVGFWILVAVFIWSLISYFLGSRMIMAFAGAKPIKKSDNPALYRVVENASIAAGLPKTPEIYIIDDQSLNAFATGTSPNNSKVAISKGMLNKLKKNELEAVMSHEIGHIINRDIRVMLLAITLVGAIQMIGEILIRFRGNGRSNKGAAPLILIGILFLVIGVLMGRLTKLAISREREYLADATGAHLCNNPDALASALEKISQDARLEVLDKKASISGLCIADPSAKAHMHNKKLKEEKQKLSFWQKAWSSHPPITERINRLRRF
jgi:heat shock protein HtpX